MELYDKNNNPIEEMFDESGNPIEEVLSTKEIDQKVTDAKEEVKADFEIDKEDLETKLTEKEEELNQAQEDLQKAGNKAGNFKELRDKKQEKESEIATLTEKIDELGKKVSQQGTASTEKIVTDSISKIADGDKDLADKIKFHYDQFVIPTDDTPEKQTERLKSAYTLATGIQEEDVLNSGTIGSGEGGSGLKPTEGVGKLSDPTALDVAKNLGLDEKELRKNKLL